jgi:hypothetical protein
MITHRSWIPRSGILALFFLLSLQAGFAQKVIPLGRRSYAEYPPLHERKRLIIPESMRGEISRRR